MAKSFKQLFDAMPAEARKEVDDRVARTIAEMPLHELRRAKSLTQNDVADRLDISQAGVSKMEQQTDMFIGSLRRYIEAMGGTLEIVARFPDGDVQINNLKNI